MREKWKPVLGYEESYVVSNLGRVKKLAREYTSPQGRHLSNKERLLKISTNRNGHKYVGLSKEGQSKTVSVERLVADAFLVKPKSNRTLWLHHKDGNKGNNQITNLVWQTPKKSIRDAVGQGYFNNPVILQIQGNNLIGAFHSMSDAARQIGLAYSTVNRCVKSHGQYQINGYSFINANDLDKLSIKVKTIEEDN